MKLNSQPRYRLIWLRVEQVKKNLAILNAITLKALLKSQNFSVPQLQLISMILEPTNV